MRMRLLVANLFAICAAVVPASALAGEADVIAAEAKQTAPGVWRFKATVRHADEGWEHYADRWEVLGLDRAILATRVLAHPHVDEQPFTRSLSGVKLSKDLASVIVRAHDSVHGYGGAEVTVSLK